MLLVIVQLRESPHNFPKACLICVDLGLPDSVAGLGLQALVPKVHWLSIYW